MSDLGVSDLGVPALEFPGRGVPPSLRTSLFPAFDVEDRPRPTPSVPGRGEGLEVGPAETLGFGGSPDGSGFRAGL